LIKFTVFNVNFLSSYGINVLYCTTIDHETALKWIANNSALRLTKHEYFYKWKTHLLKSKLSYFYWGKNNWSACIKDDKIIAIYYYTIANENMYDGYLISNHVGAGVKLDRWQYIHTKDKYNWKLNWTAAAISHIRYNQYLGYKIVSKEVDGHVYMVRK